MNNPVAPGNSQGAEGAAKPKLLVTAGQIAPALGITKRAVLRRLREVPATGTTLVRGQSAKAWEFCALPATMQTELEHAALRQNFRNAEALLNHRGRSAEPAPLASASTSRTTVATRDWHTDLIEAFADHLPDRLALRRDDREWVWSETIRHFKFLQAAMPAREHRPLRDSVVRCLLKEVPGMIRSKAERPLRSLRRAFERKLIAFDSGGREALRDGREVRSGNYQQILCSQCWGKYVALDVAFRGNESEAWRRLKQSGQLCETCAGRHSFDIRRYKSYVPSSVREAATPLAEAARPWLKSAAAGRMAGPYTPRDYTDTEPGDYFVGDDVTWNHEVFDFAEGGRPIIFRPECLYFADERTAYPLDFLLIAGHYNGRHIRLGMLNVHDKLGLPHRGFKFENGPWRSRLVRDECRGGWIEFRETEDAFKSQGTLFNIRHARARNPRSKTVEGDFRILQERMRCERGYVGFNERDENSDAQKDLKRRVLAGKEDPRNGFLSFSEWGKRISAVVEEWSNEPQNGARNSGRSPAEGWREGLHRKPLRKLPDEARWILATHRQLKQVGPRGIVLEFGKHEKWTFVDDRLSRFIGQQVWAHYHPDCRGLLTVCNYKRTDYFSMKGIRLPANTATPEQIGDAERQKAAFNRVPKVIAGSIHHPIIAHIRRDAEFSQPEKEFGCHMEAAKAEHRESVSRADNARARQRSEGLRMMLGALGETDLPETPLLP